MSRNKPRNSLVTIRIPEEAEQKSDTGLYLPRVAGSQFRVCEIIAVGPGTPEIGGLDTKDLAVGQQVLAKVGNIAPPRPGELLGPIMWTCVPLSKGSTDGAGEFLINQADIFMVLEDEEPKPLTLTNETNETEK